MSAPVGWGILGTGRIAHKFAADLARVPDARLIAVASRTPATAEAFARQHGIPRAYGDYAALVEDSGVEVVYVASPHACHAADTRLALTAGKAVLCEKPMAINAHEAAGMIRSARDRGLFLMEAMWTRCLPFWDTLGVLRESGRLGEVRLLTADFGYRSSPEAKPRLFDPALGGGALLDVGVYPVALASWWFGAPVTIATHADIGTFGIDENCAITFQHAGGQLSQLAASIRVETGQEAVISATGGRVRLPKPWWRTKHLTVTWADRPEEQFEWDWEGDGYHFEAAHVMDCLRKGRLESDRMPLAESLAIAQALDAVRAQWGLKYPTES